MGTFLEGGSRAEYAALARAARERPLVKDVNLLQQQGLEFAMLVGEPPLPPMSLMTVESDGLLSHPSKWVVQAGGGVVLGLAVVGVIYWFGTRRSRRKL